MKKKKFYSIPTHGCVHTRYELCVFYLWRKGETEKSYLAKSQRREIYVIILSDIWASEVDIIGAHLCFGRDGEVN